MKMNKIMAKLREKNKNQYYLLGICVFLSVLLVTSFTLMYFSPSIQELLPPGGDTRKLAWLMLGVTVIGCTIFTLYGTGLFLRYKSREIGVFLALGEVKENLGRFLFIEVGAVIVRYILCGLVLAIPLSYLIWKVFQSLLIGSDDMKYQLGIPGLAAGITFASFLILCIFFAGKRFIRRANIMDILNEQRKTEMVREIKPWTGRLGIFLIFTGLILAMAVPAICVNVFLFSMPSVWNLTYCISIGGLYLLMLAAVGRARKGKHPQKYYRHIVSTSLMRFTARQTTKNMCVITLLVFVLLLSAFWGAMYYRSAYSSGEQAPYDYSLHYPSDEKQLAKDDIFQIASRHKTEIRDYEECQTLMLLIDYKARDLKEDGKYIDIRPRKLASFIAASDFSRISGEKVSVGEGEYKTIVPDGYHPSIWVKPDCLLKAGTWSNEMPDGVKLRYTGTKEFDNFKDTSDPFTFILSDKDYARFAVVTGSDSMENLIFFNTENVYQTYDFAQELNNEYIAHAGALSDHYLLYDAYEEASAHAKGENYSYSGSVDLSPDHAQLARDWKYAPFSKVLIKADAMQMVAVFVLLSAYIAIISLASIGVMTYVRSITIAIDNRQLFKDLKRLGADKDYIRRVICRQLRRIFTYPTAAGSSIVIAFALLMTYFNDMHLDTNEWKLFGMVLGLVTGLGLFMYGMYRVSLRKMEKLVFDN